MARIVWSPQAREDLREITLFIKRDSSTIASEVAQRITGSVRRLSTHPESGRIVPEFGDTTIREVFAYSYRIIYQLTEGVVSILTVVHGARKLIHKTPGREPDA